MFFKFILVLIIKPQKALNDFLVLSSFFLFM